MSVFPAITLRGTERFFSFFVCNKKLIYSAFFWAITLRGTIAQKNAKDIFKKSWKKRSNVCFRWGNWKFQSLKKNAQKFPKNRSKNALNWNLFGRNSFIWSYWSLAKICKKAFERFSSDHFTRDWAFFQRFCLQKTDFIQRFSERSL